MCRAFLFSPWYVVHTARDVRWAAFILSALLHYEESLKCYSTDPLYRQAAEVQMQQENWMTILTVLTAASLYLWMKVLVHSVADESLHCDKWSGLAHALQEHWRYFNRQTLHNRYAIDPLKTN